MALDHDDASEKWRHAGPLEVRGSRCIFDPAEAGPRDPFLRKYPPQIELHNHLLNVHCLLYYRISNSDQQTWNDFY